MKIKLLAFLIIMQCVTIYSFQDLKSSFTEQEIQQIIEGKILTRMYLKFNGAGENSDEQIIIPDLNIDQSIRSYEMITDEKAFIPYDVGLNGIDKFISAITDPLNLKGTVYYSRRAEAIEELIKDAYSIDNNDKKIDSVSFKSLPAKGRFKQKDNKFGTLTFSSELRKTENMYELEITCVDSIPFISNKGEYKVYSFFMYDDEKKGFYYYSVYAMRVRMEMLLKKGGLKTLSPTTFSNRLRASTVQIAKILGLDWTDKLNPWENDPRSKY